MTIWVSWYQKDKTILDFNEARDHGVAVASAGLYANYLHLAPVQTDNRASTLSLMLFLTASQQCQSTERTIADVCGCIGDGCIGIADVCKTITDICHSLQISANVDSAVN